MNAWSGPDCKTVIMNQPHLLMAYPFICRNLKSSWALSRSRNFSFAVSVSYGTMRGWAPPPVQTKIYEFWMKANTRTKDGVEGVLCCFTFTDQFQFLFLCPDVVIIFSYNLHHALREIIIYIIIILHICAATWQTSQHFRAAIFPVCWSQLLGGKLVACCDK